MHCYTLMQLNITQQEKRDKACIHITLEINLKNIILMKEAVAKQVLTV